MTKEMAQMIVFNFSMGELYDDGYDNYGGRGMYGSQTTAVVVEDHYLIQEIDEKVSIQEKRDSDPDYYAEYSDEQILSDLKFNGEFDEREINNFRTDNLGLNYIIY